MIPVTLLAVSPARPSAYLCSSGWTMNRHPAARLSASACATASSALTGAVFSDPGSWDAQQFYELRAA